MPATALRCRICGTEQEAGLVGACPRCFGPLEPVYDWEELGARVSRGSIEQGPRSIWRYAELLPVAAPAQARLAPGWTPLVPAPRLAEELGIGELHLKLDTANPTHSFKDRVAAVACAKALELGCTTLSCSSTGNLANAVAARAAAEGIDAAVFVPAGLEPEKLAGTAAYGATIYSVNGSYDDVSRLTVELSFELERWAFVNVGLRAYYAEGSKTLAFEIAEQLGWRLPSAVVSPIASGALFSRLRKGFEQLALVGLVEDSLPKLVGAQAEGCSPVAAAFEAERPVTPVRPDSLCSSLAIGSPADGDVAVETARASGGSIHAVPERQIAENVALLARTTGVWGEAATGVALGGLRAAVEAGVLGREDSVVLLVTGDGLKTPQLVAGTVSPIDVEAEADELLERLAVATA
ncbi:MAG: threonine synthase [Gaiellaceae bacterium]